MDPVPSTLGDVLRAMRVRSGLNQEALVAKCIVRGINQGALSRWERNEAAPSAEQVRDLVRVAGGNTDELSALLSMLVGLPVRVVESSVEGGA